MSIDRSMRICQEVSAQSEAVMEYTPGDGKVFALDIFCGDSPTGDKSYIEVDWDGVTQWVLWSTGKVDLRQEFTGDGVKKVVLRLNNAVAASTKLAGSIGITEY